MPVRIDAALCPQNHRCPMIETCPVGAISQEGIGLPEVDSDLCISCGLCVESCGRKSMSLDD